jgi:hypothetical protein
MVCGGGGGGAPQKLVKKKPKNKIKRKFGKKLG